ncbi:MAG: response regulator, partial [Isosphaeraceae bacterium]|nr:response regulator [Isosphaeraceae bacterium]
RTLVFVTHDRMFLQRLATRIIEVDRARLFDWTCDYATFLARKEAALEAEVLGCEALVPPLRRVAILTEVSECLALEGSEEAASVTSFCLEALGRLAAAGTAEEAAWVIDQSSARWGDYLELLDPHVDAAAEAAFPEAPEPVPDALPEPALDPSLLLRLLGAATAPNNPAEDENPQQQADTPARSGQKPMKPAADEHSSRERPPRHAVVAPDLPAPTFTPARPGSPQPPVAAAESRPPDEDGKAAIQASIGQLDPELRAAFCSEATDLFERIEAIVVHLEREPGSLPLLHELGRCLHTLKGAAGSVGLAEFATRIHAIEDAIEGAAGTAPHDLLDRLDALLSLFEAAVAPPAAARGSTVEQPPPQPQPRTGHVPEANPAALPTSESLLRIPTERIETLMDLVSELIIRRGVWSAQVEAMKDFADSVRASRARLLACTERLDVLRPDPRGELARLMRGLTEQADDLALLAQNVQASALPLSDDGDALTRISLQLWEQLQAVQIVPVRGLFHRLIRVARDAARIENREIEVLMVGEDTGLDRAVQDKAFEPLLHVVRNAVGHGIEAPADRVKKGKCPVGCVTLEARREGNALVIAVQDDGRGLDDVAILEKARRLGLIRVGEIPSRDRLHALIFHPGFSTRAVANEVSGRGVGMDVVAQEVGRLRGTIQLASQPGQGTTITIRLPTRLAVERVLITRVDGQAFGIPVAMVEYAEPFDQATCERRDGRETVVVGDRSVPVLDARRALGIWGAPRGACPKLLVVRADGGGLGLVVDTIEGARELVIKPIGPLLAGHPMVAGTSVLMTGEVILILNPSPLGRYLMTGNDAEAAEPAPAVRPRTAGALVVDDSMSVRRVMARHLHALGFEVDEVCDGLEALQKLKGQSYRLVLTDLEMPRMDGFELLAELGRLGVQRSSPVIVVSTRSDPETRNRVHALGARAFVPKPIEPSELARAVRGLIPEQV